MTTFTETALDPRLLAAMALQYRIEQFYHHEAALLDAHDYESWVKLFSDDVYRTRLRSEEDSWVGSRHDVLRRDDDSFLVARRHILLEQTILLARNLSTLFSPVHAPAGRPARPALRASAQAATR